MCIIYIYHTYIYILYHLTTSYHPQREVPDAEFVNLNLILFNFVNFWIGNFSTAHADTISSLIFERLNSLKCFWGNLIIIFSQCSSHH